MARRKKEATREPGDEDDPFAETAPAAEIKSDLPERTATTALDDFIGEGSSNGKATDLPPSLAGIVEHVYAIDVDAEYRRLQASLELGSKRSDRATVREALDRVERDTVCAARIHRVARLHEERFELDTRERTAALRDEARRALEAEKEAGTRKKQITEGDIEDYCVVNFGDEWRAIAQNRSRLHGACRVLEELVQSYRSRQATIRMLAGASE